MPAGRGERHDVVGAELVLQLEHDPLRGLLADSRDGLEACRVAEHDRASQLTGRRAGDDGERDLRPDAAHAQQRGEELPLGRIGEAVELERVLAHVEVGLDGDLRRALRRPQHRRRRGDEVADASDLDDEPVGRTGDRASAQARDHPASLASGGVNAWQIATASASASCVVRGSSSSARIDAHHPPHLSLLGAAVAAHGLLHPRRRVLGALDPCGRGRDERGAARLPDEERDAGVGTDERLLERDGVRPVLRNERCTPSKIVLRRASGRSRGDVRQHPPARRLRRPPLSWTIPYPHAAVPGSMPRTFTGRGYGAARTFRSALGAVLGR